CLEAAHTDFLSFFYSSRRRHTRSYGDWSSDVCSSDLTMFRIARKFLAAILAAAGITGALAADYPAHPIKWVVPYPPAGTTDVLRSEERRVGKECRGQWAPQQ